MIHAMIASANADGTIDDAEMQTLFEAMEQADLSPAEKAALTSALNRPPGLEEIAASVDSPEEAAEVYGAACCAVDEDTPAETFFLRRLAHSLQLDPELAEAIRNQVAEA